MTVKIQNSPIGDRHLSISSFIITPILPCPQHQLILTPCNHSSVLHLYSFVTSRMSNKWNHTVRNILRLCFVSLLVISLSFTQAVMREYFFPFPCWGVFHGVMVIFLCQLDWAMGHPSIWSNMIQDVSVRVFLGEINIKIDWVKQTALHNAGGPYPISWRPEQNERPDTSPDKREILLPDGLQTGTMAFFLPLDLNWDTWALRGSRASWFLNWDCSIRSPEFEAFRVRAHTSALPGFQLLKFPTDLGTCHPP